VLLGHLRRDFFDQERGKARADGVVFGTAVKSRLGISARTGYDARVDEHADSDRHVAFMDQVVEHDSSFEGAVLINERVTVLEYHRAGGLFGPVLRGDVDPIIALRAGIDFAGPCVLRDLTLWHAGLTLGVGTEDIILDGWRRWLNFLGSRGKERK